jgi:hypothetical protein
MVLQSFWLINVFLFELMVLSFSITATSDTVAPIRDHRGRVCRDIFRRAAEFGR